MEMEASAKMNAFDPFYLEIKHADELPRWLQLRSDIHTRLEKLMSDRRDSEATDIEAGLCIINERIAAYNAHVPNAHLRKPFMSSDNWMEEYEDW